jgi:hypothetical protein
MVLTMVVSLVMGEVCAFVKCTARPSIALWLCEIYSMLRWKTTLSMWGPMQFSSNILNDNVAPKLSELTKCGAPILHKNRNHFAEFLKHAAFGARYKKHKHALLVVYFRRVDFACVEYRSGRTRLKFYADKLPDDNSQTRFYRLALSHFESSILHLFAANRCGQAILKSLGRDFVASGSELSLFALSNRIRHFDEDVFNDGKVRSSFGISPIWITDAGLESTKCKLSFEELKGLLNDALTECEGFTKTLRVAHSS